MMFNESKTAVIFNKLLLATDFSPSALIATEYAIGLARRFSARLELMTAIDLSIAAPCLDGLSGPVLVEMRHSAEDELERLAHPITGIDAQKKAVEGFLASSEILSEALEYQADLIVMGTTSKHGLKKFLLGSTAEDVIRNAECPVLTIGPNVLGPKNGPVNFKNILYATDFSEPASLAARYAFGIASEYGAQTCMCHVIDEKHPHTGYAGLSRSTSSDKTFAREASLHTGNVLRLEAHGRVDEEILRVAKRLHADLIVLGARKASAWLTYVTNGVAPAVLTDAECPVMTISTAAVREYANAHNAESSQLH